MIGQAQILTKTGTWTRLDIPAPSSRHLQVSE